ncbi:MAG: lytic transglycosylase domain-containing protein [Nitrospirae bacterium]|nr:lytic transglycosylase domain-containing protein [Nitrospirota bacterium]
MRKIAAIGFLLLFICGFNHQLFADIYKHVDEEGVTHFTNTPNGSGYKKIISESKKSYVKNLTDADATGYNKIISNKSQKYNIEASLVKAVIKAESNGDSAAVSRKGAMGLMQLMPYTAKEMNVWNPFDPEENIEGGTRYLKYLLEKFNGDLSLALAAYNAGPKTIERFGGIPPIRETRQYVERVLSLYNGKSLPAGPVSKRPDILYKVIYDDGTVLYTNTPLIYPGSSRF